MKQIKVMFAALAALSLFSCSQEEDSTKIDNVEGLKTYASFSVKVTQPGTYAAPGADGNADAVEQKINTLDLFVFSGGVLESKGVVALDGNNVGTTAFQTTTGSKEIYAVANATDAMKAFTIGSTFTAFKAKAVSAANADIATSDKFVMVGSLKTSLTVKTETEAKAAPIAINVSRAAAKVQLKYATGTPVHIDGTIDPASVKYQLVQRNKNMFLARTGYEASPAGTAVTGGVYDHVDANLGTYKAALLNFGTVTYATSEYSSENVNVTPVTGNTTYALVQLTFVPTTITGTMTGGTFYLVKALDGSVKFYGVKADADAAQAAITPAAPNAKEYTSGLMYYRLNIRDISKTAQTERYAVLRNNYYKINITEVNKIGGNTPTDPEIVPTDPETPLESSTFISADITITPWVAIDMNEPL